MSEPIHDPELAALQTALARLAPSPDGINVAQLLFCAGQTSVPRRGWAWPGAAAASMLLAAALGVVLALRPGPQVIVRVVTLRVEVPAPPAEPSVDMEAPAPAATLKGTSREEEGNYLKLRREVLAHGVDALPAPAFWPCTTQPRNFDPLLDLPPDAAREPWFLRIKNSLQSGDAS